MGLSSSKEAEISSENKKKIDEANKKRDEDERKERERIEKKLAEDTAKEKERIENKIDMERQNKMKELETNVNGFNKIKAELDRKMENLQEEIRVNNEKQIEQTKKEGLEQVVEGKKTLNGEKEKLIQKSEYILKQNERLSEIQEAMRAERSDLLKQKEVEEIEKMQKHHEEIQKLNEEKNNAIMEGENKKDQLAEEHKRFQDMITQQQLQLNAVQMTNAQQLQSILNDEQRFEDFRRRCKQLLNLFNIFKRDFDKEESAINTAREDIEDGIELGFRPELSDALRSLRELAEEIEGFDLSGSDDEEKYKELRNRVKTLIEKLLTTLNDIQSRIIRYEISLSSTSQPSRSSNTSMCSDLELDDSDSALDSCQSSLKLSKPKKYNNKRGNFSIAELNREAKQLISQTNDEMLNFNICASTAFGDARAIQFQNLSTARSNIVSQITNCPSTSSAAQIPYGSTSGNRSQPSIEQIEDREADNQSSEESEK